MRLVVAVPSNRDHSPFFTASLVGMVQNHSVNGIKGKKLKDLFCCIKPGASNIARVRSNFIDEALASDMTHLLFLDDDMIVPLDLLDALCAWDKPIVAANCCQKNPHALVYTAIGMDGKRVESKGKEGLEQVKRVGTGVMLLDLHYIRYIPKPWFELRWAPDLQSMTGEDYFFCDKAAEEGIGVYIDHGVSNKIGHIGSYTYSFDSYAT